MEITHIKEKKKWLALNDEVQIGELNYNINGDILVIDHTEVEPHYRGNSIAADLVQAAVDHAKKEHLKIDPKCSFAVTFFERFPEYSNLLTKR
ncbi:GNAT family N-acetyltransferase [Sphingobacterium psychroaquaticum]|uniref:Uncharacterized protein n=1 Tax=Sphingobacterium psychroaquaticum TaxID=561061 RepID=A0A1X7JPR3_9SPHI|nr:GNAT family N-acetyltransferase [Sphingobacterium psychroaquaticum]QBQ40927.1 N-acetyltransferase [Sphingobacterium psychroaquaticum]SMG29942.1 hypothetical protein SAMN05660862_1995 [Sphingobacterium psychroaquaticum]